MTQTTPEVVRPDAQAQADEKERNMPGKLVVTMKKDKTTKNSFRFAEPKVGDDPHSKNIYLTKAEASNAGLKDTVMVTIENIPANYTGEPVDGKLVIKMQQDKITKNSLRYAEPKAGDDPHSKNIYLLKAEVGEASLNQEVLVTIENAPKA